jgi:hypothetical protein
MSREDVKKVHCFAIICALSGALNAFFQYAKVSGCKK